MFLSCRERTNLKKHLIKVHNRPEEEASTARMRQGLNLKRKRLPDDERLSRPREYPARICPIMTCQKPEIRLENHLKDFHKLNGEMYKRKLKEAKLYVPEDKQPAKMKKSETVVAATSKSLHQDEER